MSEMIFNLPDAKTPGYLRRMQKASELAAASKGGELTPEVVGMMVDFLVDFVTEPKDRKEAKEALWDATQEQIDQMLSAVMGGTAEQVPPESEGSSEGR